MSNSVTSELDKYLQQAAQKRESEHNYFKNIDPQDTLTPTQSKPSSHQNTTDPESPNQEPNLLPDSFEEDTSSPQENEFSHQEHQLSPILEEEQQDSDTVTFNEDQEYSDNEHFNTAIDTTAEDSQITMGKPTPTPFVTDLIRIPTEKVGSSKVTHKLQQFLENYPPKTQEHTFEAIYTI